MIQNGANGTRKNRGKLNGGDVTQVPPVQGSLTPSSEDPTQMDQMPSDVPMPQEDPSAMPMSPGDQQGPLMPMSQEDPSAMPMPMSQEDPAAMPMPMSQEDPSAMPMPMSQQDPSAMPMSQEDQQPPMENVINEGATTAAYEEDSPEMKDFREKMSDPNNKKSFFYLNNNISTEQNKSKAYVRQGVLHFTDSMGINALRDTFTAISNFFGSKGIENAVYDKLRSVALTKVGILLDEDQRCYNTRFDFEREGDTIFVHIYGTLYKRKE